MTSAGTMRYAILLTQGAEHELDSIVGYLSTADGAVNAHRVLAALMETIAQLEHYPDRGSHPSELLSLGIKEFRQVFFKPYRVIYRIIEQTVTIVIIADGRRDFQSLLARRLLRA